MTAPVQAAGQPANAGPGPMPLLFGWLGLLLVWALATLAGLLSRPMIPVDELRYADVAWEMWQRHDFLVPYLNGAPYSHKPPLFFWLIHAGWSLFGVSEGVVRMIAPLMTLLGLVLVAALARLLWPRVAGVGTTAAWVLFSGIFLLPFSSWVQIDLLLVDAVLLAVIGIVLAARQRTAGWWVAGLGIGLGLLSKGPVVLLHVMPLALLAPLWIVQGERVSWKRWYPGALFSVLLGAALVLAWALPAAEQGGAAYREAILWGQTANRVVESFAHAHPFWWYLPWLPLLFAPWVLLPWLWSGLRRAWQDRDDGMRLCLIWMLNAVLLLSLVSGKQAKYLLPMLPAFALLVSRVLLTMPDHPVRGRPWLLALAVALLGVIFTAAPFVTVKAEWLQQISPWWGVLLLVAAAIFWWLPPARPARYPLRVLLLSLCVVLVTEAGVLHAGAHAYDLKQASRLLGEAQAAGKAVAITERYHGQFGFYGRLRQPVEQIEPAGIADWSRAHPGGYIVMTGPKSSKGYPGVIHHQVYQSGYLAIVTTTLPAADIMRMPICPVVPKNKRYTIP